jgi:hypothetical protein
MLEARLLGGGEVLGRFDSLVDLANPENKLGSLQRDDYFQLEIVRYF